MLHDSYTTPEMCHADPLTWSPAGHARSASASDSSGASETCAATLTVDPLVGIPRIDSPSCVSSHPIHASSEGSPAPDQNAPVALPEPMVITVEAGPGKCQEGTVPIMHAAPHQPDSCTSCGTQEAGDVDIHPEASHRGTGSSGQVGQDQSFEQQGGSTAQAHPAGQQASSSGQAKHRIGIADRIRAAVASRGFEPCLPSTDNAASCSGQSCGQTAAHSTHAAAEQMSERGSGPIMICHPDSEAGLYSALLCPLPIPQNSHIWRRASAQVCITHNVCM